jgi:hypothetical protein
VKRTLDRKRLKITILNSKHFWDSVNLVSSKRTLAKGASPCPWPLNPSATAPLPLAFSILIPTCCFWTGISFFPQNFANYIKGHRRLRNPNDPKELPWPVYHIPDPEKIGDLMGAIHGVRFTGFIGEVYKRYPFPERKRISSRNPREPEHRPSLRRSFRNTPPGMPSFVDEAQMSGHRPIPVQQRVISGVDPLCVAGRISPVEGRNHPIMCWP